MNPLNRTIKAVTETDLIIMSNDIMRYSPGKKLFQLVKHVTGQQVSKLTDYEVIDGKSPDDYFLSGQRGYIRVTLEPLFEVIE